LSGGTNSSVVHLKTQLVANIFSSKFLLTMAGLYCVAKRSTDGNRNAKLAEVTSPKKITTVQLLNLILYG